MNKELKKIAFEQLEKLNQFKIEDEVLILDFDKQKITLESVHERDCCESVYAEWEAISDYSRIIGKKYESLTIKGVEGEGLLLCFDNEKVFIPCYNEQNGYYSDDLSIIIKHNGRTEEIDIYEYKKDNIE